MRTRQSVKRYPDCRVQSGYLFSCNLFRRATALGDSDYFYASDSRWLLRETWHSAISGNTFDLVRYGYTNGKPSRIEVVVSAPSDLTVAWTYGSFYPVYNWHGDTATYVNAVDGSGGGSWGTYDPWGNPSASGPPGLGAWDYYRWNGAWGYQWHAGLGLYYVHGRWYSQDTGMWLSPDEKGEYRYGSGQDAVNWAWVGDSGSAKSTIVEFMLQWMHGTNYVRREWDFEFTKRQIDFLQSRNNLTLQEALVLADLQEHYDVMFFGNQVIPWVALASLPSGLSLGSPEQLQVEVAKQKILKAAQSKATNAQLLSNSEVRQWYNDRVKGIKTDGPRTREFARTVHQQRNMLKAQARALMADRDVATRLEEEFPLRDFEYYVQKYSAQGYTGEILWERIIQGGTTPNPSVNQQFGIK